MAGIFAPLPGILRVYSQRDQAGGKALVLSDAMRPGLRSTVLFDQQQDVGFAAATALDLI